MEGWNMSDELASRADTTISEGTPVKDVIPDSQSVNIVNPLYQYFDMPDKTPRLDEILGKIWSWAKEQSGDQRKDSVLYEVIKLKHRLGEPSIGEKPWAKILNYISIQNRVKEDQLRLEELERK
jgi:hypothetical protein